MASDQVKLSYTLAVSEPGNISISNPETAKSLRLVATVRQESSPFPDRTVTLLTTASVLDPGTACSRDAFGHRAMSSPKDVSDDKVQIKMYLFRVRARYTDLGGPRDMCKRADHVFITVPPPGQGSIEVTWSLAPEHLLRFYEKDFDIKEQLRRMFTPGQRFEIGPTSGTWSFWWTWGSLEHDLRDKKLSRWSLPDALPNKREAGQDEGDEINRGLITVVGHDEVRYIIRRWELPGTPDPDDEEPPKVKEMREDGWIFGEPVTGLELMCTQTATFEFVE